jgi:hypothetical protein
MSRRLEVPHNLSDGVHVLSRRSDTTSDEQCAMGISHTQGTCVLLSFAPIRLCEAKAYNSLILIAAASQSEEAF